MGLEPWSVHVLFTLRVVVAPSPGHAPLSALVGSQTSSHGPFCALIRLSSYSADGMADDARHGGDVPETLRTARLTGRGMRERCGAGQELHVKVVHSV